MNNSTKPTVYAPTASIKHLGFPFIAERPERITELDFMCDELGLKLDPAGPATDAQLNLAHDTSYIDFIKKVSGRGPLRSALAYLFDPRIQYYNRISSNTFLAATYAVGAVCNAVDNTVAGVHQRSFCIVRPPGHHAGTNRGEGFCIFNNVAIGALYSRSLGLDRVAIVDFDRHHGNGTAQILDERGTGEVLLLSSFQSGCKYSPNNILRLSDDGLCRIPIPEGSRYQKVEEIYKKFVIPTLIDWEPDLIFISAGFDMHASDPLTNIKLASRDYYSLTRLIVEAANMVCDGKVISVLEGGYNVKALEECVRHHLRALKAK